MFSEVGTRKTSPVRVRTNFTTKDPNDPSSVPSSLRSQHEDRYSSFETPIFRSLQPLLPEVHGVDHLQALLEKATALNKKFESLYAEQKELVTAYHFWVSEQKNIVKRRVEELSVKYASVDAKNTAFTFSVNWELLHDGIYESDRRTRELKERNATESLSEFGEDGTDGRGVERDASSVTETLQSAVPLINIFLFSLIIILPNFIVSHS